MGEGSGFFIWVRLELGVDIHNEGGSDGKEQTGLLSKISTSTFEE